MARRYIPTTADGRIAMGRRLGERTGECMVMQGEAHDDPWHSRRTVGEDVWRDRVDECLLRFCELLTLSPSCERRRVERAHDEAQEEVLAAAGWPLPGGTWEPTLTWAIEEGEALASKGV